MLNKRRSVRRARRIVLYRPIRYYRRRLNPRVLRHQRQLRSRDRRKERKWLRGKRKYLPRKWKYKGRKKRKFLQGKWKYWPPKRKRLKKIKERLPTKRDWKRVTSFPIEKWKRKWVKVRKRGKLKRQLKWVRVGVKEIKSSPVTARKKKKRGNLKRQGKGIKDKEKKLFPITVRRKRKSFAPGSNNRLLNKWKKQGFPVTVRRKIKRFTPRSNSRPLNKGKKSGLPVMVRKKRSAERKKFALWSELLKRFLKNLPRDRRLRIEWKFKKIKRKHLKRKKKKWVRRKYRFSRWRKFDYQKRHFFSQNHLGMWALMALHPHRLRRRRYQPYRYRKAYKIKKNKWYRLLNKGKKPGYPPTRAWRLRNQQQYQKLYSNFYYVLNRKTKKKKNRHFLRIRGSSAAKRNVLFSWVERRIDVALCRMRLAPDMKAARILVAKGFVLVNRKQVVNINRRIDVWDIVTISRRKFAMLRYWYLRGRFRRYVFKKKKLRFKYIHQEKSGKVYGFIMKVPFDSDVPKKDLTTVSEVERFFLTD